MSPMEDRGYQDGLADKARVEAGKEPFGPCPPNQKYPGMYRKGYFAALGQPDPGY